jgi:hypothetical protein
MAADGPAVNKPRMAAPLSSFNEFDHAQVMLRAGREARFRKLYGEGKPPTHDELFLELYDEGTINYDALVDCIK